MAPYRLSDDERDEAISALADAYVDGRLDEAEFDSRMGAASRAIVATDLDPLFADLPARRRTQVVVQRRHRQSPHRGWPVLLLFVVGLIVLTHVWLLIPLAFLMFRAAGHRRTGGCASSRRARGVRS